jgi:hypothetical protein
MGGLYPGEVSPPRVPLDWISDVDLPGHFFAPIFSYLPIDLLAGVLSWPARGEEYPSFT